MDETKVRRGRSARPAAQKQTGSVKAPAARAKTTTGKTASRTAATRPWPSGDREARVRMAAYYRAEQRGFAPGHELADWFAAEAEVDSAPAAPKQPARPRKSAAKKS
jgi:hypothetical protein